MGVGRAVGNQIYVINVALSHTKVELDYVAIPATSRVSNCDAAGNTARYLAKLQIGNRSIPQIDLQAHPHSAHQSISIVILIHIPIYEFIEINFVLQQTIKSMSGQLSSYATYIFHVSRSTKIHSIHILFNLIYYCIYTKTDSNVHYRFIIRKKN